MFVQFVVGSFSDEWLVIDAVLTLSHYENNMQTVDEWEHFERFTVKLLMKSTYGLQNRELFVTLSNREHFLCLWMSGAHSVSKSWGGNAIYWWRMETWQQLWEKQRLECPGGQSPWACFLFFKLSSVTLNILY